jgi:hypothetical protein
MVIQYPISRQALGGHGEGGASQGEASGMTQRQRLGGEIVAELAQAAVRLNRAHIVCWDSLLQ